MKRQKRFRASIYVDIFIDEYLGDDQLDHEKLKGLEEMREEAKEQVQEIVKEISKLDLSIAPGVSSPYVGGVALMTGELLHPLDREI